MAKAGKALGKLLDPRLRAITQIDAGKRKRPKQSRVVKRRSKDSPMITMPGKD